MLALLLSAVFCLAPLEPLDGTGIYFGAWYDRPHGDTPRSLNGRFGEKKLSIWQSDFNISDTLQTAEMDQFIRHYFEMSSDAIFYVTLYPMQGFDVISDKAIDDFIERLERVTSLGTKVFFRYASEMNGNWFRYGCQPTKFLASWRRIVGAIRTRLTFPKNVAVIWAPNSGNGYPFGSNDTRVPSASPVVMRNATYSHPDFDILDTNGDGRFDHDDDPYTAYYPGDEWVDWIGFSIYHYGYEWPWVTNDVPVDGKVESILTGRGKYGPFNLYRMFSGDAVGGQPSSKSKGGKPFMITETGSTIHLLVTEHGQPPVTPSLAAGRVNIKRAWWRQLLDPDFLARYPKIKAICTFEFVKHEETSWRDFTNFGNTGTGITPPGQEDPGIAAGEVLEALKEDLNGTYGRNIIWAQHRVPTPLDKTPDVKSTSNSAISSNGYAIMISILCLLFAAIHK